MTSEREAVTPLSRMPWARPAANLGPFPPGLIADWLAARLAGKPIASERWFVQATGQVVKTAL